MDSRSRLDCLNFAAFDALLTVLEKTFVVLSMCVPQPSCKLVNARVGFDYRYTEQSHQQALVLKVARLMSALQGVRTLTAAGLYQEQGALQRIVDEVNEDILFIISAIEGRTSPHHERFFKAFWAEEFPDSPNTLARHAKRDVVDRRSIRAHIHSSFSATKNPSLAADVGHSLSSVYSGFVHGASSQIMDMYFGRRPPALSSGSVWSPELL